MFTSGRRQRLLGVYRKVNAEQGRGSTSVGRRCRDLTHPVYRASVPKTSSTDDCVPSIRAGVWLEPDGRPVIWRAAPPRVRVKPPRDSVAADWVATTWARASLACRVHGHPVAGTTPDRAQMD